MIKNMSLWDFVYTAVPAIFVLWAATPAVIQL